MKIDEKYDYIICGGGATGLLLSHSLISDSFFDNKKVLVIEKEIKIENDRTFSFWDNQKNILDKIVFKSWGKAEFKDMEFSSSFSLKPYKYKMVRSDKFYSFMKRKIEKADAIELEFKEKEKKFDPEKVYKGQPNPTKL